MGPQKFIDLINAKQDRAYRELFEIFYRYLVVFTMRYVQEQQVAEDIVQEVMVNIWEGERTFDSLAGLRAFMYESAKNKALNYLKHRDVEKRYVSYALIHHDYDEDFQLMREEMYRRLYRMAAELPPRCREVFMLHLQGQRNDQIAATLNIAVETVKVQKKKAMKYLRERLGDALFMLLTAFGII